MSAPFFHLSKHFIHKGGFLVICHCLASTWKAFSTQRRSLTMVLGERKPQKNEDLPSPKRWVCHLSQITQALRDVASSRSPCSSPRQYPPSLLIHSSKQHRPRPQPSEAPQSRTASVHLNITHLKIVIKTARIQMQGRLLGNSKTA